jgi:hypothetical protein
MKMSNLIVKEVETHTGVRYEIVREITRDDLEILKRPATEVAEHSKFNTRADAWAVLTVGDDINAIPEDIKFSVCQKPMYISNHDRDIRLKSNVSVRKEVKYNGLRTDETKMAKYNKVVAETNARFEEIVEERIDQAIAEANENLRERVKILNDKWADHTIEVYTSVDRLNIESVDKDAGVEEIHAEIDTVNKKIEALEAQVDGLREALRKKRVAAMIEWAKKGDEADDPEKSKSAATLEPIRDELIEALKDKNALREHSHDMLFTRAKRVRRRTAS